MQAIKIAPENDRKISVDGAVVQFGAVFFLKQLNPIVPPDRVLGAKLEIRMDQRPDRSEEHTSELQSLMRISYAVFCLKKKNKQKKETIYYYTINHNTQQCDYLNKNITHITALLLNRRN